MRSAFLTFFFPVLASTSVFSQSAGALNREQNTVLNHESKIFNSNASDTSLIHIWLKDGAYDAQRAHLPYYPLNKESAAEISLTPKLKVIAVKPVSEPHASVIKRFYSSFIGKEFSLEPVPSVGARVNYNHHRLLPFRFTAGGQIEELTAYEVDWQNGGSNPAAKTSGNFKTNSVLATGNWYKLGITQTGIYRINRSMLAAMGINTKDLDPRRISIYGNGGQMVPELNSAFRYDDLEENAIYVAGQSDGTFDNADYILFYGKGPVEWTKSKGRLKFSHQRNRYTDTSFYYLTIGPTDGLRVQEKGAADLSANVSTDTYDYYNYHEEDVTNFGKTGREFVGENFDIINSYSFNFPDGNFVANDSLIIDIHTYGAALIPTVFDLSLNNMVFQVTTGVIYESQYSNFAAVGWGVFGGPNQDGANISVTVTKATPRNRAWLDKFTINARRRLAVLNKQYSFRDTRTAGSGRICTYNISAPVSAGVQIWNVSDFIHPQLQNFVVGNNVISFTAAADTVNEYCIAPPGDLLTPAFVGKVSNQNLHAIAQADYVIVTHPLFLNEAKRIGLYHEQNDGLTYAIATTDQVYNEFGSGKPDIAAIRDFVRMLYSRNLAAGKEVKYLLLVGDGSYNNKNRNLVNNSNLIPTYQSRDFLSSTVSLASDDFFGMMQDNEGAGVENQGNVDIGVGRFPCRTVNEVKAVIAKIENYYRKDLNFQASLNNTENCNTLNESPMGDWRNWLLFLGDDEDGGLHMWQSNKLTEVVRNVAPGYNLDKIFLDAYQRFSTPGGARYPDASADFIKRVNKGALIFNYTGHGGEVGLTAERMVDMEIIGNLTNYNKLGLFITATCEFARYDDPNRTSAGEFCLLSPKGGAIALCTTARLAYAEPNYQLNIALLEELFRKQPDGRMPTLGQAMMRAKARGVVPQVYSSNFHLLGDPAVRLAYPEFNVRTTVVNEQPVSPTRLDTLKALSKITVAGIVCDSLGNKLPDFNGVVFPTVFDKEKVSQTLLNSATSATNYPLPKDSNTYRPLRYLLQKNILYRGKAQVVNGEFSFTFIVPKDIGFSFGPGKISYYASNGASDAAGYFDRLIVGSTSTNTIADSDGPEVKLYLNDQNFIPGGLTNERPVLYADLTDSSGINTLGTGIGHDISVVLDENTSKPVILNDYYEANLNSYQSGRVRYPYEELAEGPHRLSFKVWDIQNNSSMVHTDFVVSESAELALKHVLNYPNPFTTRTRFLFQHNQACNPLKVVVQIYSVSGKIVKTINENVLCNGYMPEGIEWDGRDDFGDKLGRGVYIYRLAIIDPENKKAEKVEKLVILN